jgi:hypothetical protein
MIRALHEGKSPNSYTFERLLLPKSESTLCFNGASCGRDEPLVLVQKIKNPKQLLTRLCSKPEGAELRAQNLCETDPSSIRVKADYRGCKTQVCEELVYWIEPDKFCAGNSKARRFCGSIACK